MAKRPPPPRTIVRDGAYWFSLRYTAELLSTKPRTIEMLVYNGHLTAREEDGVLWIAEADVTRLRRNPALLATTKRTVREDLTAVRRAQPLVDEGYHLRQRAQDVLPIADYRHKMPGRDC